LLVPGNRKARQRDHVCYHERGMTAPTRPNEAAWEPEALELPLETPRRPANRVPYWQDEEVEEQRSGHPPERERGSHVIVIDMA
jgi:hypothetical protein